MPNPKLGSVSENIKKLSHYFRCTWERKIKQHFKRWFN
jgi:hypothetical protein